jgi:uncharacterized membrane protein YedE/YeeE
MFHWSLAIGFVAGWVLQRTHFCTMGAISDYFLFRSKTRLKAWFLAMAVAMLVTTTLRITGYINISASIYLAPSLGWMGLLLGGWLFGFGMVLAGGCASRNVVRMGSGSLKALCVVMVMSITAAATSFGWLRWMPATFDMVSTPELHSEGLGLIELLGPKLGGGLGTVLATLLMIYCLADKRVRSSPRELAFGLIFGLLIPLGWIVTGSVLVDGMPDQIPQSLGYIVPAGDVLRVLTSPFFAVGLSFAVIAWIGTFLGALGSAWIDGSFRFETFSNHDDMVRHLLGGALLGVGGVLAAGCTIGQGLSGLSTLAPATIVSLVAMFLGARQGLRYLETGIFFRFLYPETKSPRS